MLHNVCYTDTLCVTFSVVIDTAVSDVADLTMKTAGSVPAKSYVITGSADEENLCAADLAVVQETEGNGDVAQEVPMNKIILTKNFRKN